METSGGGRVCVIGAGIAGLVTAKVLRHDGFDVTVFERQPAIGGVWAPSRCYPGLRANNPRETYAFSDFPYPADSDVFPTAEQIRDYLDRYVDHFGLRSHLHLSTEVRSVDRAGPDPGADPGGSPPAGTPRFRVTTSPTGPEVTGRPAGVEGTTSRTGGEGTTSANGVEVDTSRIDSSGADTLDFDFVVVCNGVFSRPHEPELPGREAFRGRVVHSSAFTDPELVRDRRVVVVGAGKSGLDCATAAARLGGECTLLCRAPHWMFPRYVGGVRMDRLFVTRFAEFLLPPYHGAPRGKGLLQRAASPLVRLWWALQTRLVPRLCGMPPEMIPDWPLPHRVENVGVGAEFYEALREGALAVRRDGLAGFSGPGTLRLSSGEEMPADTVILATGWRAELPFLSPELRGVVRQSGSFRLYRHILPPGEPRLGFVGYASSTACPWTSEIAAHWLSHHFLGHIDLPSSAEMDAEVERLHAWLSRVFPTRGEGYFIGPYLAHYTDELMRDMGLAPRRARHLLAEYMGPFWSKRYRGLPEWRRQVVGG